MNKKSIVFSFLLVGLLVTSVLMPKRAEGASAPQSSFQIVFYHWDLAGTGDKASAVFKIRVRINSSDGITDFQSAVAIHEGPYGKVNRDSIRVEQFRKGRRLPGTKYEKTSKFSVHNLPSAGVTFSEDKTLILLPLERPQVGDELEFEWVVDYSSSLGWPRLNFQDYVPVGKYHYSVRLLPGEALKYFSTGIAGPEPIVSDAKNGGKQWVFEAQNVPPFVSLPGTVSQRRSLPHWTLQTSLWVLGDQVVSTKTWADLGKVYFDYIEDQIGADDKVSELASSLASKTNSDAEFTRKAFEYVRDNIRYSAVFLGEGGYYPVKCAKVDSEKKGDCKGMAVLLYSLLRKQGVPAGLSLVMTRDNGVVDPEVPTMRQFNHMIAWAELEPGKKTYMDATSKSAPFGLLPNGDRMNHSLAMDHNGLATLEAMPLEPPESTLNHLEGKVSPGAGGSYQVNLRYRFSGYTAARLVHIFDELKGESREKAFRRWGLDIFPGATISQARGQFLKKSQEYLLSVDMMVDAEAIVASNGRLKLFPYARLDKPVKPQTEGTNQVYSLNYPHIEQESWTFRVPKQNWDLPKSPRDSGQGTFLRVTQSVTLGEDGVLKSSRKEIFFGGEVKPSQVELYRKETRNAYRLANAVAKTPK